MDSNMIKLAIMLGLTSTFFFVELTVGFLTKTLSLVADSFHMLSDALSMVVGIIAIHISKRSKTQKMTYGYHRAQTVGGLVNGIALLTLCFTIFVDAIERYIEPQEIKNHVASLSVACAGLAINLFGMILFRGHAHIGHDHGHDHDHDHVHGDHEHEHKHKHKHKEKKSKSKKSNHKHKDHEHTHRHNKEKNDEEYENDSNQDLSVEVDPTAKPEKHKSIAMHSVFLHILGDALGSIAVIASVLFTWLTKFSWKVYVDPTASLIVALILVVGTVPLVKRTIAIVMQRKPRFVDSENIENQIKSIPGVKTLHDFHLWQLDEKRSIATFHILCSENADSKLVSQKAKEILHDAGIHSTTIQIEHSNDDENLNACLLKCNDENCSPYLCCESDKEDEPLLKLED